MKTLDTSVVLRNDSTANWEQYSSRILLKGEVGIEFLTDGKIKIKIGDGVKTWNALDYFEAGFEVLSGTTAPTTSVDGESGQLYVNTTANKIYICVNGGSNTWKQIITPEDLSDLGAGDMLKSEFATSGISGTVDKAQRVLDSTADRNNQELYVNDDKTGSDTTTNNGIWTANKIKGQLDTKVGKVDGKQLSTNDYTDAEKEKLGGIESGAEANVQTDWNVTDASSDAYLKNKPTSLPADGGNADTVGGKAVDDTQTTDAYIWTAAKTKAYADGLLAANDAMTFKGVVNDTTDLPDSDYNVGDTYKVASAGTYAGQVCEVGDMIIRSNTGWEVIQANIDGAVTSSETYATDGTIAIFDGTTGRIIKQGTKTISDLELKVATSSVLGGVKSSELVTVESDGALGLSDDVVLSTDTLIINGGSAQ